MPRLGNMLKIARLFALPISTCLALSAMASDTSTFKMPDREKFRLFLLARQSNMAGRGDLAETDPAVNPRILMLTKDGSWQYARDPVHYDKKIAGVGLARSFAEELLEHDEAITIGLIPTAIGGSPIADWEPGAYHEKTATHPYDDAITRAGHAIQDGTLAGILWHQGEGDSGPEKSIAYKDRLIALVERFRRDLGTPEVPFIIGQLGQFEDKPWTEGRQRVNQAHIETTQEIPYAGFVSSDGLTSKDDNTHFNTTSLREFGRRYAEIYLQVAGENP